MIVVQTVPFKRMHEPKIILLLSGKRKSGKDFISEQLAKRLGDKIQIVRISEPIKSEWAKKLNLDLKELLSDGPYKEKYRKDMIEWSDQVRSQDYGYFCREAAKTIDKDIVIVSDIRRKNDIKFFKETYSDVMKTVRIQASEEVRIRRGWKFQAGVDDVQSECDLDDYEGWDLVIQNDNTGDDAVLRIVEHFNLEKL